MIRYYSSIRRCSPSLLGAFCLMLLRIFDKASVLSVILVIIGLTSMVYNIRQATSKKDYIFIAGIFIVTFTVRFYGYTGDKTADILLGPVIGLTMFAIMGSECLLKRLLERLQKSQQKNSRINSQIDLQIGLHINPQINSQINSQIGLQISFRYTLVYPITYLLFLYFTEIVKINMPFRLDTYLSCIPVLCQITAVCGIYSIDFLLAWTASVIAFIIGQIRLGTSNIGRSLYSDPTFHQSIISKSVSSKSVSNKSVSGKSVSGPIFYVLVLCSVICYGIVHYQHMNVMENAKTDTVRVAYAAGPYCGDFTEAVYAEYTFEQTMSSFIGIIEDAAAQNAEILIFSEEAYCITDAEEESFIERAKQMAIEKKLHLLLAYEVKETDDSESGKGINKLCWISDEGEILYDYTKHCLVPIVETSGYVRGDQYIEPFTIYVHGQALDVATAICYDADFDLFMSHMGQNIDLLLLPTWDWNVIAEEHFSVARMRAIASETTLIRCVYDGWNAIIDSAGNILTRANTNDIGYATVSIYDIPIKGDR